MDRPFRPSVCRPSVTSLRPSHCIIMEFSDVITIENMMPTQTVKVRGQRLRSQKKRNCPNLDRNSRLNSRWLRNGIQRLKWHRRVAPLFCEVIHQISGSHGLKTWRLGSDFSVSGYNSNWNSWTVMEWHIKIRRTKNYYFSMFFVKFQGHMERKISDLAPILVFPDDNTNLNSRMATKLQTELLGAWKISLLIFQSHPSNSGSHRPENWRFGSGLSKLSNPSDLVCLDIGINLSGIVIMVDVGWWEGWQFDKKASYVLDWIITMARDDTSFSTMPSNL